MGLSQSKAEYSSEYSIKGSIVADACREIIQSMGLKLSEFSPQTGMISAKAPMFSMNANRELILQISKSGEGTSGRAQKLITEFFSELSSHPALAGKSKSGW